MIIRQSGYMYGLKDKIYNCH